MEWYYFVVNKVKCEDYNMKQFFATKWYNGYNVITSNTQFLVTFVATTLQFVYTLPPSIYRSSNYERGGGRGNLT